MRVSKLILRECSRLFFCLCSLCVRTFRSESVHFCFVRGPFSVTNGAFKRADLFHHNMLTYSWCTPIDKLHRDSSLIMTPSGLFWSLALRVRTILSACRPFSPRAEFFLLRERTVFYHTRTSARRARGSSSFARTTPSRTRTIFILEDPGGYFRVVFA